MCRTSSTMYASVDTGKTSSADRVQEHSTGSPKTGFAGTSPDCQRASMLLRLFSGLHLRVQRVSVGKTHDQLSGSTTANSSFILFSFVSTTAHRASVRSLSLRYHVRGLDRGSTVPRRAVVVDVDRRDLRSRRNSLDRGRAWKISERVNREGALRTPDGVGRHAHDNMPLQGDMAIAHPIDRWSLDWDWDGEGLKFQWIDVGEEMQEQGEALVEEKEVQLEVEDLREQCRIVCTELVDRERHAHESDHQKQKNVQKQDVSRVNTQHVDPQKEKRRPATTQEARPRAASALAKRSCSTASSASKRSHVNKTDTRSSYVSNEVQRVLATLDQVEKSSHLDRDWQAQMDALGSCRRLLVYKKETLVNQLHRIVVCTLPSVNSLRSNIAKQALTLFMEMFRSIPAEMNRELELVAPILLQKASDTSFLGQAADEAIKEMIDNCDEMQALNSLLKSATQRSSSVRLKVASHLEYYIVKKGLGTLLEQPAMLKAMFLVIAGMMGEGNQYTRTMAKRSLWFIFEILGSSDMWEELILSIPNVSHSNEVKRFFNSASGPPEVTALSLALGRKKSLLHTTTKRARQKSSKQQLWKAG